MEPTAVMSRWGMGGLLWGLCSCALWAGLSPLGALAGDAAQGGGELERQCAPLSTGELPEWCEEEGQGQKHLLMGRGSALVGLGGLLGIGIGYEYALLSWLSVGGGVGITALWSDVEEVPHGGGIDGLVTVMTPTNHRVALSLGVSFSVCDGRCSSLWELYRDDYAVEVLPVMVLAYRYQPLEGKGFFELGLGTRGAVMEGLLLSGGVQF